MRVDLWSGLLFGVFSVVVVVFVVGFSIDCVCGEYTVRVHKTHTNRGNNFDEATTQYV